MSSQHLSRSSAGTAWFLALGLILVAPDAHATVADQDLATMSIEQLMEIEVTSVSKREQKLSEAPAAVTVLTAEDIRRSGMNSIPELLRLVPGLHVAQISANTWAITARGFNSQFANKLLVMIDGRSVYTPLFSGVYWDVQDPMLEDIERIEVVRGPGGTLWGANAVNGVINIITKSAGDTQGLLFAGSAGTRELGAGQARWGGSLGDDLHYRSYFKYFNRSDYDNAALGTANDAWEKASGGVRFDWQLSESDALTVQGDYYGGKTRMTTLDFSTSSTDIGGGNVLARWVHGFSDTSDLRVQSYYDRTERDGALLAEDRDTFDLEAQHRFAPLSGHDVIWGAGYRLTSDEIRNSSGISFTPPSRTDHLFSAFVQDQIEVLPERLSLIVGSKFEHNDYSGFEVQPSGRLLWTPHGRHTVWAAISRAIRSPSRAENDVALFVPTSPTTFSLLSGTRSFDSEKLLAYELGYRAQPLDQVSVDVALYYNDYEDLRSIEPGAPLVNFPALGLTTFPFTAGNNFDAVGYGLEILANWRVTDFWTLTAGYTLMKIDMEAKNGTLDPTTKGQEDDTPTNQVQLRSRLALPWNLEVDPTLLFVDEVSNQGIGDYTRFDLRLGWRPLAGLELSLIGQNLFERKHPESGPSFTSLPTSIPRSMYAKAVWTR